MVHLTAGRVVEYGYIVRSSALHSTAAAEPQPVINILFRLQCIILATLIIAIVGSIEHSINK